MVMGKEGDAAVVIYNEDETADILYVNHNSGLSHQQYRLISWEFRHDENMPKEIVVVLDNDSQESTKNILNTACNLWYTGGVPYTGKVKEGFHVALNICGAGHSVFALVFDGIITSITPQRERVIITAVCPLAPLDQLKIDKTVYASYRDYVNKNVTTSSQWGYTVEGVTESNIVSPLVFVGLAKEDINLALGTGGSDSYAQADLTNGGKLEQPFNASGDGLIALTFRRQVVSAAWPRYIYIDIYRDDGTGLAPAGPALISGSIPYNASDAGGSAEEWSTIMSNAPTPLVKGKRYWAVFTSSFLTGETCNIQHGADVSTLRSFYWETPGGGARTYRGSSPLKLNLYHADYEEIESDNYLLDETNDRIVCYDQQADFITNGHSQTYYRGRLSFYYGTVTHQTITERLLESNTDIRLTSNANMNKTVGIYRTRGKSLYECLYPLLDEFDNGDVRQFAMGGYWDYVSSYWRIKIGQRYKASDSSLYTFSFGLDDAVDTRHKIIEWALKTTQKNRPSTITLIGRKPNGQPIPFTMTERVSNNSDSRRMGLWGGGEREYDENLVNLNDVAKAVMTIKNAVQRDTQEGEIVISGCYDDLMQEDDSSAYYGSGRIITLNLSPLGLTNQKFNVKGVTVTQDRTTIRVSNYDILERNEFRAAAQRSKRNDSFLAPTDLVGTQYVYIYDDGTWAGSVPGYMTLKNQSGNELPGLVRPLAQFFSWSGENAIAYWAEFDVQNGYSTDGDRVNSIALYDAQIGGTLKRSYSLYAAGPPVRNERFDKWRSLRIVVCWVIRVA